MDKQQKAQEDLEVAAKGCLGCGGVWVSVFIIMVGVCAALIGGVFLWALISTGI